MNTTAQTNLKDLLEQAMRETVARLKRSAFEVAAYTTQRTTHLAGLAGQPGFAEAVTAERDAVATFAGIRAVGEADAADSRILGIIEGALAVAAGAVA